MTEVKVLSEVSGAAFEILVAEGQTVAEGDELMIAEVMKMEIPLAAPGAGTVKRVCVEQGALIAEGDLMFVLEA